VLLALWNVAHGQQPPSEAAFPAAAPQPAVSPLDRTEARLQHLLSTAAQLEATGQTEQARAARQEAETLRQVLVKRLEALQAEVERLRQVTGSNTQVVVHLKVLEVPLAKLRALGFDLAKLPGDAAPPPATPDGASETFKSKVIDDARQFSQLLDALRKDDLVKVLAEPTLVTLSGKTAQFECGGRLPVLVPQPDGSTAVEHQHYGTQVKVKTDVLADGRIRLDVYCRLGEIEPSNGVRVGKETSPGLRVREFQTGVELQSGQTLLLTGLVQQREERREFGVPILSKVPYANRMFKNVGLGRDEIATLVLVRPEIVHPGAAAATPAARNTTLR
jgi:pilus assembly protein CpaC